MKSILCFIGLALFGVSQALYPSSSAVIDLTPGNFDSLVMGSDDIWIVEFYAPWCGHCKALVPEYQKAAKALKGVVKIGAVNADEHRTLGGRYGVQGFPTIKIFGANKNKPTDYNGARTADGFVDVAFKELRTKVNNVLGGKSGSSGSKDAVIELTDSNFDELVMNSEDPWMVEFFAPWCGHCQRLAPEWASAAAEMKGKVKFGAVDATVHTMKAGQYNVRGFPTIKFFPGGKKNKKDPEDYDGGRDASSLVSWATEKAVASIPPPEVKQAVSQDVLKEACGESLCIVAVLPHILDCQSKCRNEYISTLTQLGDKFKKNQWGWVWVEAGSQPALEESLELGGFGYPAMAVMNKRKGKYSTLRGSFDFTGINEFLRDLSYGRGTTAPLRGGSLPEIGSIEPWDGKDGAEPVIDDIDLSDVDLDDLGDLKTEL